MPDVIAQGLPIFAQAIASVGILKYPILFLGAIIEGPIITLASGFLLHSGAFEFWPLYLTLGLGDLVGDIFWYGVGSHFARPVLQRHGRFLTLTPELFERIEARFHRHHSLILFTSKITMGFGMALAMLTAAGAARVPFKSFMFWNMLGEIVYVGILLTVGYFLGNIYGTLAAGFKTLFVVASSVILVSLLFFFAKYLKSRFSK